MRSVTITGRRLTLTDCGCEATVYADGSGIELHYCPLHQAAKQLLEALTNLMEVYWSDASPVAVLSARRAARAAIKAAGG